MRKHEHVHLCIQCGSQEVYAYCQVQGYDRVFEEVGATFIERQLRRLRGPRTP